MPGTRLYIQLADMLICGVLAAPTQSPPETTASFQGVPRQWRCLARQTRPAEELPTLPAVRGHPIFFLVMHCCLYSSVMTTLDPLCVGCQLKNPSPDVS